MVDNRRKQEPRFITKQRQTGRATGAYLVANEYSRDDRERCHFWECER